MEDDELRQKLDAITARIDQNSRELSLMVERNSRELSLLVETVKESLEREIARLREGIDHMDTRLIKITAGAHYVSRLVEWSDKQDVTQADLLKRVQRLEQRLDELQHT
jgi:hypothetical protein